MLQFGALCSSKCSILVLLCSSILRLCMSTSESKLNDYVWRIFLLWKNKKMLNWIMNIDNCKMKAGPMYSKWDQLIREKKCLRIPTMWEIPKKIIYWSLEHQTMWGKSSPSVRRICPGECRMSPSSLVLKGDEHVIKYKGREALGLSRANAWDP